MKKKSILIVFMALLLVISVFSQFANLPRNEILITELAWGRATAASNFNAFITTAEFLQRGVQQLMLEPLWMNDQALGE
ncbi:MAG TPA: ABC transporter substrate-binding protein, partial [Defluviitoga tunisiensis]|nr:ABC transporter substrate-binding protein [Defluviitoga tunisiensis]HPZ67059.1 ABC transporter substrate-binding protein [Defluviitoga tunisiensis]HQD43981.1 ABC transporter substrate-binding protein [Defluviitoga tunisiensis]